MLTEKDCCDYKTCVALKELGFDWDFEVSLWDAQKWLREEKGIFVMIEAPWKTDDGLGWSYLCCNKPLTEEEQEVCVASGGFYDSYEEALLEGIKTAVKLLKAEK